MTSGRKKIPSSMEIEYLLYEVRPFHSGKKVVKENVVDLDRKAELRDRDEEYLGGMLTLGPICL